MPDDRRGRQDAGPRAVCVEYLDYNEDGTIKPVVQTAAGVTAEAALGTPRR